MSHVTTTAQPSSSATPVSPTLAEDLSKPGVRKVLEAYAEREVQKVRWGAVIAGLFLAGGTKIMLMLLGHALGIPGAAAHASLAGFSAAPTPFTVAVGLIGLFVGGFVAAKLSGSIRRSDGIFAGVLTWSTAMVVGAWIAILMGLDLTTTKNAWFTFGGALLSLMTAMLGGAKGSVSGSMISGDIGARRRELRRKEHEAEEEKEVKPS